MTILKIRIIPLLLHTPSLLPLLVAGASELNRAATCVQVLAAAGLQGGHCEERGQLVPAGSSTAPPQGTAQPDSQASGASGKMYSRKGTTLHRQQGVRGRV